MKIKHLSTLRVRIIESNDEKESFWHLIDLNHTLTLEHVWKSLCHPSNKTTNEIMFQCNDNANLMPLSSSVHLLNNNDKLKIVPLEADSNKTLTQNVESISIKNNIQEIKIDRTLNSCINKKKNFKRRRIKTESKQKQLRTIQTNRSFIITSKDDLSKTFFQQWNKNKY